MHTTTTSTTQHATTTCTTTHTTTTCTTTHTTTTSTTTHTHTAAAAAAAMVQGAEHVAGIWAGEAFVEPHGRFARPI